jgi:hypothetical protein
MFECHSQLLCPGSILHNYIQLQPRVTPSLQSIKSVKNIAMPFHRGEENATNNPKQGPALLLYSLSARVSTLNLEPNKAHLGLCRILLFDKK